MRRVVRELGFCASSMRCMVVLAHSCLHFDEVPVDQTLKYLDKPSSQAAMKRIAILLCKAYAKEGRKGTEDTVSFQSVFAVAWIMMMY